MLTCTSRRSDNATLILPHVRQRIARFALVASLFTFLSARVLVLLIMTRRMPDMFLHLGGTHVHHLNYGIFLLSIVGGVLLLARPDGRTLKTCAVLYGIGLALTFDEFGMWLHLGGSYWQRASFDAVVVIAAVLGLIAFAPSIKGFRVSHWTTAAALAMSLIVFALLLKESFKFAHRWTPRLIEIEQSGPT